MDSLDDTANKTALDEEFELAQQAVRDSRALKLTDEQVVLTALLGLRGSHCARVCRNCGFTRATKLPLSARVTPLALPCWTSWAERNGPVYVARALAHDIDSTSRDAWNSLGSISKEDAKALYVETLTSLQPQWRSSATSGGECKRAATTDGGDGGGGPFGGGMGLAVSRMQYE